MINKGRMVFILATAILLSISSASAQTKYQTNCFSPYTTNPNEGKAETITMISGWNRFYQPSPLNISFIGSKYPVPSLEKISLSAPTGTVPPCEDRQDLGYNSATMGYNDAYIVTSQGDVQLGYPKNAYANEANSIRDYISGEYTIRDYAGPYPYYRYAGFDLTPPLKFVGSDIDSIIANSDKIINDAVKGNINIRIGGPNDYYIGNDYGTTVFEDTLPIAPVIASVPATNCLHMSGTGPKSIVFMRDSQWSSSGLTTGDFLNIVQNVDRDILSISPYKENGSRLSFYADLTNIDTSPNSLIAKNYINPADPQSFIVGFNDYIGNLSSCGNSRSVYIFINGLTFSKNKTYLAYAFGSKNIYMGIPYSDSFKKYADAFKDDPILGLVPESAIEDKYAYVVIHELGHALGGLADEYGAHNEKDTDPTKLYSNCSPSPFDSFSYQGYIYGNAIKECFLPLSSDHRPMYKPSKNSLMHNQFYGFDPSRASESAKYDSGQRYNIISCAYISEALNLENGKKMTADGAKKYFQACQKMDTVQNGYGTITQPPQIGSIDNKSLKPNQMMMVKITSR